ncbi:MAG: hypothetical protein IJX46_08965 [Clostridia bacterium]|nr:hypothetical protein [Clostridia bacterium]
MIITFIGHANLVCKDELRFAIRDAIIKNAEYEDKWVFYCGGYGNFDMMCADICHCIKKEHQNSEIVFITPYMDIADQAKINDMLDRGRYDSVIYPPIENIPKKFAIVARNRWMIEESDLIVAYVDHNFGGAYNSYKFALRKNKKVINLYK